MAIPVDAKPIDESGEPKRPDPFAFSRKSFAFSAGGKVSMTRVLSGSAFLFLLHGIAFLSAGIAVFLTQRHYGEAVLSSLLWAIAVQAFVAFTPLRRVFLLPWVFWLAPIRNRVLLWMMGVSVRGRDSE